MTRFQAVAERSTLSGTTPAREQFFKNLDDLRAQRKWRFKDNYVLAEKSGKCASGAEKVHEKSDEKSGTEKEPREVKNDAPLYWQVCLFYPPISLMNTKEEMCEYENSSMVCTLTL